MINESSSLTSEQRPIMFENRISNYFQSTASVPSGVGALPAFIACPLPLLVNYSCSQQSFVAEIYRRAQELTESQMRKSVRRSIPEFSLN
jgi:hypothetical protein